LWFFSYCLEFLSPTRGGSFLVFTICFALIPAQEFLSSTRSSASISSTQNPLGEKKAPKRIGKMKKPWAASGCGVFYDSGKGMQKDCFFKA
jgi:hypothetical protein